MYTVNLQENSVQSNKGTCKRGTTVKNIIDEHWKKKTIRGISPHRTQCFCITKIPEVNIWLAVTYYIR